MNYDTLETVMVQIDWDASIKFCQRGEPLLSPLLIEAIEMANKKGLRTVINTNGFYLEHFATDLVKAGLTELIFSDYNHPRQFQHGCMFSATNQFHGTPIKFTVKTDNPKKWIGIAHHVVKHVFYDYLDDIEDNTPLPEWKCPQLFERMIIEPDGFVRCCCGSVHIDKYIGKIFFNSLKDIWESKKLERYRKLHDKGLSHQIDMCRKCAYRRSFINT
jgi:radical SAM protein with 4Fe4S-binding SPASM domain